MKKLMIAAAAAAMISGAFAEDLGYDFTATVKTTQGKNSKAKTTYNVALGYNEGTDPKEWWYKDDDVLDFLFDSDYATMSAKYTDKKLESMAKKAVNKLKNDEKWEFIDYVAGDLKPIVDKNKKSYYVLFDGKDPMFSAMEFYNKKWTWCHTFKVTQEDEDCYRAPATVKLTGELWTTNCCSETWELVVKNFGTTYDPGEVLDVTHPLLYRINGITLEKANKVEVTGVIGPEGIDAYDGEKGGVYEGVGTFAYAGQGDFDVKAGQIKNIDGNIVGVLFDPDCEECCNDDVYAIVFYCLGEDDNMTEYGANPDLMGTAAFGTFSIKYNKKLKESPL